MKSLQSGSVGALLHGRRRCGGPIVLAAGLWAGSVLGLHAESDHSSSAQFFLQDNARATQPTAPAQRLRPILSAPPARAPAVHHAAPTFRRVLMQRASAPQAHPAASAAPPAASTTVAVYGDRLGQALANGLQEDTRAGIAVNPQIGEDAGLAQPGFEAWLGDMRDRLARPDHPSVGLVMIGANDWQRLPDGGATAEPGTARWQELYGKRVDAVVTVFRNAHVPLIWVGLPTVHSDETSAEFVRLNGIFRDRATKDGATYVDSWEAFSDDAGRYSPVGPDVEGQTVKLRKADGFGFTRAGSRKLASFVESDIKRMGPAGPRFAPPDLASIGIEKARDFDQALNIDVNAQIRREAGLLPNPAPVAAVTAKPAAGPVISLTSAPLAPDGRLVSLTDAAPGTANAMQANLVAKPFSGGAPIPSQPGRADDFSWPKP